MAFVVYGVITEASIPRLFAAGVIPCPPMGVALVIPVLWMARTRGGGSRGDLGEIGRAAWGAKWGLMAPVVILGGIYGECSRRPRRQW